MSGVTLRRIRMLGNMLPDLGFRSALRKIGAVIPEMFHSLLGKPATESYPYQQPELSPRFSGKLDIDPERCTGCQVCAMVFHARVCAAGI